MHFSLATVFPVGILSLIFALFPSPALADGNSYFQVLTPTKGEQWPGDGTYPVMWSKGLLDGVSAVDVELARLTTDGLILVALNVPTKPKGINLQISSVPPADDYFLIFLNVTHSKIIGVSDRFTILPTGTSSQNSSLTPVASVPTVTVSGGPNPTALFATTFAALSNAALSQFGSDMGSYHLASTVGMLAACTVGAAWTLLL